MILADYFRSDHDLAWDIAKQCGVKHGVIRLPERADFDLTDKSHWKAVYDNFIDFGVKPIIVEPMPNEVHDHIKVGDEKRDESIEKVIKMLPIMKELGMESICFNWMAHVGWHRTNDKIVERGGAFVSEFKLADFKDSGKKITADELWNNYEYFLKAVIPHAEKNGIKLALHPDDPPLPRLGDVERIMINKESIKKAIYDIVPSDMLGLTMCQATFHIMGEDVYKVIEEMKEKIFFIHFRNTTGHIEHYRETFHDNGELDMPQLIRTYMKHGIDVPIRVDHVPTLVGENPEMIGYAALGRLFAIGYMKGIIEMEEKNYG